jgi:hypothetical protein
MLHPPESDAFPTAAPHAVPAQSPPRKSSGLARWWHSLFARNAYARGPDTPRSGRSGHRPFQHLIDSDDGGANDAPGRGETGKK